MYNCRVSLEIAKDNVALSVANAIMPKTSPNEFITGPPDPPLLTAASVCKNSIPDETLLADNIPFVTVASPSKFN